MNPLDAIVGLRLKLMVGAAVVTVVGGLYGSLWLGKVRAEKDRDTVTNWAVSVCSSVGTPYRDDLKKPGQFIPKSKWGLACEAAIRLLAYNAANAVTAVSTTVTTHDTEQTAKGAADRPAARRSASRIQTGQTQMETAIVKSPDGLFGSDYFDGLNRSLGLRPYQRPEAAPAASGDHAQGAAVIGPDGVQ